MYRALVADDEPMILAGIDSLISWEEYGIEIAAKVENGKEALEIILQEPIDLLITDIRMPVMSGLELLKELRKAGKHTKTIVLSGYDDFHYVKEANRYGIENYLLKPVEENELEETLLNLVEKWESEQKQRQQMEESYKLLRNNILHRWMSGTISREEWESRVEFLSLPLQGEWYQACILKPGSPPCAEAAERLEQEAAGWGAGTPMAFTAFNGNLALLFFRPGPGQEEKNPLAERFLQNRERLQLLLGTRLFVAVGPPCTGWDGAAKSCRAAERLLDYRLVLPPDSVISSSFIREEARASLKNIDWKRMHDFIQAQDAPGFEEYCRVIFSERAGNASPDEIRILACEVLFFLSKSFEGSLESFRWEYFREVFHTSDMQALLVGLRECAEIVMQRHDGAGRMLSPVVSAVLSDMQTHYQEDLSLKGLAQKYKINAAYLGQLFKNETGELFSACLCRIRIARAKELLAGTDWKTGRVAELTGFRNVNYFSNTFKRAVGLYPSEYRLHIQLSPDSPT